MSEEQKQIDYQYVDMGGYAIPWIAYGLQIIGITSPKREFRHKVHDIIAEKRSDAILGNERLYDPETGEVYEFKSGF